MEYPQNWEEIKSKIHQTYADTPMPGITGKVRSRLIQAGRSKALILFSDTDQFVKETLDDLAQEGVTAHLQHHQKDFLPRLRPGRQSWVYGPF